MFYIIPTKRGLGVELWGTYDGLRTVYEVIGKFWGNEDFLEREGFKARDDVISGFVYEIRKAYSGSRLNRSHSHFTLDEVQHFGCEISWVHILFSLSAIRCNMSFFESDKLDLAMLLQLEYWIEKSMINYDEVGARQLQNFISDGIHRANPYLYLVMRSINADYFELRGGKTAFRKLPSLLKKGIYGTSEYNDYHAFLIIEAQRLNCQVSELELNDENVEYDKIKW